MDAGADGVWTRECCKAEAHVPRGFSWAHGAVSMPLSTRVGKERTGLPAARWPAQKPPLASEAQKPPDGPPSVLGTPVSPPAPPQRPHTGTRVPDCRVCRSVAGEDGRSLEISNYSALTFDLDCRLQRYKMKTKCQGRVVSQQKTSLERHCFNSAANG